MLDLVVFNGLVIASEVGGTRASKTQSAGNRTTYIRL
jgi:hypothetical protein